MINKIKKYIRNKPTLYGLLIKCKILINKIMFEGLKLFSKVENKVVFQSFGGKSYSCNPRAISEELRRQNKNIKIIWLFNNPKEKKNIVPDYVKCVKNKSLRGMYELVTAKFWVDNFNKPRYTRKRKGQFYIQTWHGDRGFKRILYDNNTGRYKDEDIIETKYADLMTVGSSYGVKKVRSAFRYNGELLEFGTPRNDLLLKDSEDLKNRIKESLDIPCNAKVVLYAPTFRESSKFEKQGAMGIDFSYVLNQLKKKMGHEWKIIVRAHSTSKGLSLEQNALGDIIDATKYEDMADLLLISDILITDYSSSAGDFILKKKPIILYQPDREDYMHNDRKFYFNIDDSPFIIANCQEELIEWILKLDTKETEKNCEDLMKFYGVFESGEASKKTVEYILNKT